MKSYIKAISYYLPETILSNSQLAEEFPEWTAEKIAEKIGVGTRHISGPDEFTSDMAVKAATRLFEEHSIQPAQIDFVILCTQSPDYFLPTTACMVQDRLGIPISAGALDFNLGCSGYIYGLAMAKGFIAAGIAKNILFITAETYSKFIHPQDKGNRTIFGDAASATLISIDGFAEINEFELGTDGRGAKNLIVEQGALRHPDRTLDYQSNEQGFVSSSSHLHMEGSEIFNFTSTAVPVLVKSILTKSNLTVEDLDLVVFHQANKFMLNHLRKKLKISEEVFFYHMEECGNTVSSSIPIALYEAMKENKIKNNGTVLLAGFGVGYSWGATVLTFNN
jgi:3-oxoacyl-[acyl-carrier-protein] synthase-3